MKKHIFLVVIFVISLTSCGEDFVTIPIPDRPTIANYYKSEADVRAATASMYGMPWFDYNDKFCWVAGEGLAGNMYHTWDQEGQFFYYSYNAGNAHINTGWRGLYRVISYANAIINDMPVFAAGKIDQAVITKALAEARCIRGTAYYFLTEYFGEVPIVENSSELVAQNNIVLAKNTKASLFEFIKRDLEFAGENLPSSDQPGRVTKWSAKGMLAKLYLTMGQYNVVTDGNKAIEYFNQAKNVASEVIDQSGLSLVPKYEDLFKIEHNNNQESLIAMQWMEGNYATGNSRQANWARSSLITGNTEAWGGFKGPTVDFIRAFEPGDMRRKSIFMRTGDFYPEINKKNGGYLFKIVNRDPADPNTVLENAPPTLTAIKKYVVGSADDNAGKVTTGQAAAINQYILRLSDIYLVYVEAAIGSGQNTSDSKALGYYNTIRDRAGLSRKTTVSFAELLRERRVEFGFEGLYWLDLKRFFYRNPSEMTAMMSSQLRDVSYYRDNAPNAADENSEAGYVFNPVGDGTVKFRPENINLPIPASEVTFNPKLGPGVPAEEYEFK
jgi:starch-binding outer membrane protein, SusD/RagB family